MRTLNVLEPYADRDGNRIVYTGEPVREKISITFHGRDNVLTVAPNAKIVELGVDFGGDGAVVEILPTSVPRTGLRFGMRLGHDSGVRIGENVGSQGRTMISAVEGSDVIIGDDCMLAMGIEIRSDDAHPIYDVRTGQRINMGQSVTIGDHVWIAKHATVMGGVRIGSGSVVGYRSIVTSDIPNNSIAAGSPARVIRRDIAWERPMVVSRHGDDVLPRDGEKTEEHWRLTEDTLPDSWPLTVRRPVPLSPEQLELAAESWEASSRASRAASDAAAEERAAAAKRKRAKELNAAVRRGLAAAERKQEKDRQAARDRTLWARALRKVRGTRATSSE